MKWDSSNAEWRLLNSKPWLQTSSAFGKDKTVLEIVWP
jgi:hypothetical protein